MKKSDDSLNFVPKHHCDKKQPQSDQSSLNIQFQTLSIVIRKTMTPHKRRPLHGTQQLQTPLMALNLQLKRLIANRLTGNSCGVIAD